MLARMVNRGSGASGDRATAVRLPDAASGGRVVATYACAVLRRGHERHGGAGVPWRSPAANKRFDARRSCLFDRQECTQRLRNGW